MLVIRLLGGLRLEADGQPLDLPGRHSARVLLSYLALNPGLHARSEVAARLWPDVLESSARSSLRSALASIRRSLGERAASHLVSERSCIGLADQAVWVDALELQLLIRSGRLEDALALGDAQLLQGFDEEWVYEAQERHRARLDALLAALAERAETRGDLGSAIGFTRQQVALEPLAEPANRDLMRRLAAAGDRASALTVYRRLSQRFQRDLRAIPSRETRLLAEGIRAPALRDAAADDMQDDAPLPLPAAVTQVRSSGAFVGRSAELRRLTTALGLARGGERQVVLVSGEPGVGKTRLLAEFAACAREAGVSVLCGRCHRAALTPYEPFVEALRQYAAGSPVARLRRELPELAGELRPLIPELEARLGDLAGPLLGDPEGERDRLLRSILATVLGAGRERSIVLLVDDLHWADPATVRLLEHLLSASQPSSLMIALSCRDSEQPEVLRSALRRARRLPGIDVVPLERLDRPALEQMVRSAIGEIPAGLVGSLERRTGGNPLFVEALVDRMRRQHGRVPADALGEVVLPELVTDVIGDELARLSPSAKAALVVAAVVGDEFDFALLRRTAGGSEDVLLDGLDEAVDARLVRELQGRAGSYEFRHPVVREVIYAGMTATRRASLHRRIGEALEVPVGDGSALPLRQIAEQLLLAGQLGPPPRAAEYAARAAREAEGQHCHGDAAEMYAAAVDSLGRHRPAELRLRCELQIALGHARRRAGQADAVREAFECAAALGRRLGDATLIAESALGICSVPFFPGAETVDALAVELLEDALARTPNDAPMRARLLARLGRELYFSGRRSRTQELTTEALALARRTGDAAALGDALDASHLSMASADDLRERLALADQMIDLGEQRDQLELVVRGRTRRAVDLLELGDLAGMAGERNELSRLARELRQPAYGWWGALWQATEAIVGGRLDEGEQAARRAVEVGAAAFGETAVLEFQTQLFWMSWARGTIEQMSVQIEALAARYTMLPALRCTHVLAQVARGEREAAGEQLRELAGPGLRSLLGDAGWMVSAALLAEACADLGDSLSAERLYRALLPRAGRWAVTAWGSVCLCPVSRPLALLAATSGAAGDADRHFADATTAAAAIGAAPLVARLEREQVRASSR